MKKVKLNIGDVFYFQIDDANYVAGQIIYMNKFEIEVIIFDKLYNSPDNIIIEELINSQLILMAYTMDSLFKHDRWKLLGNVEVIKQGINNFKIETPEGVFITDGDGKLLRKANAEEIGKLKYKKNNSPAGIVNAVKCYYKMIPYEDYYGNMFYK